jgi:hypothetical protein
MLLIRSAVSACSAAVGQLVGAPHGQAPWGFEFDNALTAQFGNGATDCFNGNPDMIGNVVARHRQDHRAALLFRQTSGHRQKITRDLLCRGRAALNQNVILEAGNGLAGALIEEPIERRLHRGERIEIAAGNSCRQRFIRRCLEAEEPGIIHTSDRRSRPPSSGRRYAAGHFRE